MGRQSNATRFNCVIPSRPMRMNLASVNKCLSRLEFLSARLQLFQVRLRRAVLSLTLLKEPSASWTWRFLTLAMPAMKSKKAMVDAARLADELRAEQDHANTQASAKKSLETQFADLEGRLVDAEAAAMKGGKAAMAKMEMRIRELETELGNVQGRTSENMK